MMAVVGAGVARVAKKDLQLGPYTIPKNAIVWVPTQAMHSSADLWDRPDKYMPVRARAPRMSYFMPCPAVHQGCSLVTRAALPSFCST